MGVQARTFAMLLFFVGCGVRARPVAVNVDETWSLSLSNLRCKSPQARPTCGTEINLGLHEFQSRLISSFAAEKECRGVAVAIRPAHIGEWTLMIDYSPEASAQSWNLFFDEQGEKTQMREGVDAAERAALSICRIVRGAGASVAD